MSSKKVPQEPALDGLADRAAQSRFKRFEVQATNRPIDVFIYWLNDDGLDLSPPYQRGVVWGIKRKRALIRSLVIGVPIPAIVLNNRVRTVDGEHSFTEDQWKKIAVIDGKQRICAIIGFMQDEFTVPGAWFGDDRAEVRYSYLPKAEQLKFGNIAIPCAEGTLVSLEEEQVIFDLINFSGLAQGEKDSDLDERMYPLPLVVDQNGQVAIDRDNRFWFRVEWDENGLLVDKVIVQRVPRQRKKAKEALLAWLQARYSPKEIEWRNVEDWPEEWRIPIKL